MKDKKLNVLEAYTRDVARGIARIDYDVMDELNMVTGDFIKIIGGNSTVAKCMPLYPTDGGKGIMRLDGVMRTNLKISIGKSVKIKKIGKISIATAYIATPKKVYPPVPTQYISEALESVPLCNGMNVMIPYFGGKLEYAISDIRPDGMGIISNKSICHIMDKPMSDEYLKIKKLIDKRIERKIKLFEKAMIKKDVDKMIMQYKKMSDIPTLSQIRQLAHVYYNEYPAKEYDSIATELKRYLNSKNKEKKH